MTWSSRRRARHRVVAAAAILLTCCADALAADPLNDSDRAADRSSAPASGETQTNVLPVAGGTTDIGAGVGEFAGITRVRPGADPYVWNLESAGLITFKPDGGRVLVPYQDVYVKLTVPRLFGADTELEVKPEYTTETTLGYYGIGNTSKDVPPPGQTSSYFWYSRMHPSLVIDARGRLANHLATIAGIRYTQDWMTVPAGSKLAADLASPDATTRGFLGPTSPHAVAAFEYGLQWDNRDSDVAPHSGSYHQAEVHLSPGGTTLFPYRYGEATIDSRAYVPLGKRLVVAVRAVGDLLFGQAPVYALARVDEEYALGGPDGVRGIPAQRYAGKVKVFGTVEPRVDVASFHAFGKSMLFGLVAFFDGGRVWADLRPRPDLDGTGVGLKYGVGAGARVQSGEAFVLRADVAWSPDARPIGGYVAAGETF